MNKPLPLAMLIGLLAMPGLAQVSYTCTDAKGERIVADRPIATCLDREQKVLNPSGTVRRTLPPSLTAEERRRLEEKDKEAADARNRQQEERRRDRALVMRYPNQDAHDKERANLLAQLVEPIKLSQMRVADLAKQRLTTETELEFYKNDPAKVPESLKRQMADIEASLTAQQKLLAEQHAEIARINQRFDAERDRLRQLWNRD